MRITEIVALVSAIAFILTVAYIYGFSHGIEVNLLSYFSINDYIKFSVYWLPKTIFFSGLGFCYAKIEERFLGSSSKDKIGRSSNMCAFNKFVLKHENLIILAILYGALIFLTIFIVYRYIPKHVYYMFRVILGIGLWGVFFNYILKPNLIKKWISWKVKVLMLGPIIIMVVNFYGLMSGALELEKKRGQVC